MSHLICSNYKICDDICDHGKKHFLESSCNLPCKKHVYSKCETPISEIRKQKIIKLNT